MALQNIVSWNVNGIRAITKKDFFEDIQKIDPDILCIQETKATVEDTKKALSDLDGYHLYANESKTRKGYSGTAVLTKTEPQKVSYDIGIESHDKEGRVITLEFQDFFLINVYVPNSGQGMKRLDYRSEWDKDFFKFCKEKEEHKPVILTGDLNVAHTEKDIARPKENYNKTSGFTQTEIDGLERFLDNGFIDTFRFFYPDEIKYSWWNYRFKARERNVGWRIDYFLVTTGLKDAIKDASIFNEYFGSDHCPVALELNA